MGVVFEAYDTVIERRVALKMLRTDVFAPEQLPDVRARFKREAHSAGRLSHPNIVTIFDYGEHEGAPYIAMDPRKVVEALAALGVVLAPEYGYIVR